LPSETPVHSLLLPFRDRSKRGEKEKGENYTTQKAKDKRRHGSDGLLWFYPDHQHYIRPFKSTSEPAAETRNSEENTQPVCPQYIVQGQRSGLSTCIVAPLHEKLIGGWWRWQCKI